MMSFLKRAQSILHVTTEAEFSIQITFLHLNQNKNGKFVQRRVFIV
jgi:hypothetical protein